MLREVDEALCTVVLFVLAVCAAFTIGWLLNLVQEVHRQFWPRDRYLSGCATESDAVRLRAESGVLMSAYSPLHHAGNQERCCCSWPG